ncbi:MAG: DUF1553 domain-containing protein, partial [Bacteroidota bacterium]
PFHPELLDWLALRFMNEHRWSIKALIKEIVMSGTYRQQSESSPSLHAIDPSNRLYARGPRTRLSAEQIRDQALAVAGLLSEKMYGPSVMPLQPDNVWQTVYSREKWVLSEGEDRHRRGLYTYLKRTSPYPSFMTFDASSREVCTIRRTTTNTPLQALVTLNDPVYLEAAYHLAVQMQAQADTESSINYGYTKALYKALDKSKEKHFQQLYEQALGEFEDDPSSLKSFLYFDEEPDANLAALTVVASAILNLDEFITKS